MVKFKIFLIIILSGLLFTIRVSAQEHSLATEALYSFGQAFFKQHNYFAAKQELEKCLLLNAEHKQAKKLLQMCDQKLAQEKAIELALDETRQNAEPEIPAEVNKTEKPAAPPTEITTITAPLQKGAWTLKKGEFYTELYTKFYWHNHKFDAKGKKKRWDYDGKGNELRAELKLEYGYSDKLTLMLYTVTKEAHWKDSFKSCTQRGFVEIWPGGKYRLFENPFICSLQGRLKVPFSYSEEAVPALGAHQIDAELKILTAQSWPKLPGYTKFEFGFRGRNEEPANEIPYFFEIGYNLKPKIILKTTLDGSEGLAPYASGTDEDWLKYTVGPIFKIKKDFNAEFGFGHTFYGKNTSAAKEVFATLSYLW